MMRKKGKLLSLALIFGLLAIMVSGSLAYFTSSETAHNVITTGGVDVELVEKTRDKDGNLIDFPSDGIDGVMPGMVVDKIVSVKAEDDSADCWVRVIVEIDITDGNGKKLSADGVLSLDYDKDKWTEKDGLWYCNSALSAGQTTPELFTKVTFSSDLSNEYQNSTATITVHAEAVQSRNNGATALDAVGWPQ